MKMTIIEIAFATLAIFAGSLALVLIAATLAAGVEQIFKHLH